MKCYLFFKDDEVYKRSKYSLMVNTSCPLVFPAMVEVTSIEKETWEQPTLSFENGEYIYTTPKCGNPRVTYYSEDEFRNVFEVKAMV